jgi:Protein of unknown function (DUF1631)
MTPPAATHRLPPAIQAVVHRLKAAAAAACERTVESLGLSALSAATVFQRDGLLTAQFELNRKSGIFCQTFDQAVEDRIVRDLRLNSGTAAPKHSDWDALQLVDDHELDVQVNAERFGLEIGHACEWELRELDGYIAPMMATVGQRRLEHDRNPVRPETIGYAVIRAIEAVSERPEVRRVLEPEFARSLAATMPQTYAALAADLRSAGLKADGMSVRVADSRAGDLGREGSPTRTAGLGGMTGGARGGGDTPHADGSRAAVPGRPPPTAPGHLSGRSRSAPPGTHRQGAPMGQVDAEMMALMRRLTKFDARPTGAGAFAGGPSGHAHFSDDGQRLAAPNIIRAHRDELRDAAAGALDHMVIDVVGSLFDQILSDPKVPPQMARQIARLQVPVLRAALGDSTFFSSRKHPVRRFINRIASLATAMEDFEDEKNKQFLALVRDLVQGIVDGDFDQAATYERQLVQLEQFVAEQASQEVASRGNAPALLAEREADVRIQQRYSQQLQAALQGLPAPEFVRDFLTVVWSQVLVRAERRGGLDSPQMKRMRHAGRELFMSVQPKGTPAQRKEFLIQLPKLMQELTEGMDLIGWPEMAKKTFFGLLLPAHAHSLKGEGLRTLDFNLLAKQVEQVFDQPLPRETELSALADPGSLEESAILPAFSDDEARGIGLMPESAIDWDGKVDIDLSAEAPVTVNDLVIQGMPTPEPVEPMHGASLADHVQIGFAYQMHLNDSWQKVRLSHVSPGRTFFVFTYGKRHLQTVSLTYRMLVRMSESGRLRAFENAYLLERATARARRQLASLRPAARVRTAASLQ